MPDTLPPPARGATPDQVVAQLGALITLLDALRASAASAGLPQSVSIGLDWLKDDATGVLADARAAQHRAAA